MMEGSRMFMILTPLASQQAKAATVSTQAKRQLRQTGKSSG